MSQLQSPQALCIDLEDCTLTLHGPSPDAGLRLHGFELGMDDVPSPVTHARFLGVDVDVAIHGALVLAPADDAGEG